MQNLAICPVVEHPAYFALDSSQKASNFVAIPYSTTFYKKLGVVSCFSPLFYNERWQLVVPTLEVYRQLGISLQVFYIQSMISEIFDFIRVVNFVSREYEQFYRNMND